MYVYAVIDIYGKLESRIEDLFEDSDRCQAADNVWFVRSDRLTSAEIVDDLGIKADGISGIVVSAQHYDGFASRNLVQKLAAWERENR